MAEVITMLALSPTMDEGTLVEWLKKEGDVVKEGELIAEIETDKATMEMESFHEGVLLKLLAQKGDALPVGAALAIVGAKGEDVSDLVASLKGGKAAPAAEPVVSAPASAAAPAAPLATPAAPVSPAPIQDGRLKASPVARKMATEAGLNLSSVEGSGPAGRIVKRDVEEALTKTPSVPAPVVSSTQVAQNAVPGDVTQVPLSQMRKTIARRLVEVWTSTPHFYVTAEFDMARAMAQRKQINNELAAVGSEVKISVNDMIIKASAMALKRYPKMNVSFQGDHIAQYADVHVGVAVAVDDGLITPVIRNADQKSLSTIANEVRELAGRARERRLKPHEYTGGTFSISNLGMFGIDEFSAIINPPEAAILACGAVQEVPVVVNGEIKVGTRMRVTLSCDHRAVDGATGAEFLAEMRKLLENPMIMLV